MRVKKLWPFKKSFESSFCIFKNIFSGRGQVVVLTSMIMALHQETAVFIP